MKRKNEQRGKHLDPETHRFVHTKKYGDPKKTKGRPKSGRALALDVLDELLSETKVRKRIKADLRLAIMMNGFEFFKDIIMPLVPKQHLLSGMETNEKLPIRITFDVIDDSDNDNNDDS
jgi:hypothetical protein